MEEKRKTSFTGFQLKLIGWGLTILWALGMTVLGGTKAGLVLQYLGLPALPIFAFLLVEGFVHTQKPERYVVGLAVTAFLAEPVYDFAVTGSWFSFTGVSGQNPLLACIPAAVELYFLRYKAARGGNVANVLMVIFASLWAYVFNIRCGISFMLMAGTFFLLRENRKLLFSMGCAVCLVPYITPALGLLPLSCYDGERGALDPKGKYLFYCAFPVLWAVLAVVRLLAE